MTIPSLDSLDPRRFETAPILRKLASASRQLGELGVAGTIPNQGILINTLGMREAKDSSAIENISRPRRALPGRRLSRGREQRRGEGSAAVSSGAPRRVRARQRDRPLRR